jgi:hypothetical protein
MFAHQVTLALTSGNAERHEGEDRPEREAWVDPPPRTSVLGDGLQI